MLSLLSVRQLFGPNTFLEGPGITLEYTCNCNLELQVSEIQALLSFFELPVDLSIWPSSIDSQNLSPLHLSGRLVVAIARAMDAEARPERIPTYTLNAFAREDIIVITSTFIDPFRAQHILLSALRCAKSLLAYSSISRFVDAGEKAKQNMRNLFASGIVSSESNTQFEMTYACAKAKGIPVAVISNSPPTLLLGQGNFGRFMYQTFTDRDSTIGTKISKSKFLSNQLIQRLGFPGVQHVRVTQEEHLARAVQKIGFPLVVKPISNGQGNGVFANINSFDECIQAFHKASNFSNEGVLIERFVKGEDHRLAVFSGKLAWAVTRSPPSVVGDGSRSIKALIQIENARRSRLPKQDFVKLIELDNELFQCLHKKN